MQLAEGKADLDAIPKVEPTKHMQDAAKPAPAKKRTPAKKATAAAD